MVCLGHDFRSCLNEHVESSGCCVSQTFPSKSEVEIDNLTYNLVLKTAKEKVGVHGSHISSPPVLVRGPLMFQNHLHLLKAFGDPLFLHPRPPSGDFFSPPRPVLLCEGLLDLR